MADTPRDSWSILELLRWSTDYFRDKGVSEPRVSAEVLLAHALTVSRLDLYLRHDQPLTAGELARFKSLVVRRRAGEPVAYLTGHKEFWSLDFRVTPEVLIPRPETEFLVAAAIDAAKEFGGGGQGPAAPAPSPKPPPPTPYRETAGAGLTPAPIDYWGVEIGVGAGAVVITLARELPQVRWAALDVSAAALTVARDNARRHAVAHRIHFLQTDLLSGLKPQARFALMVANLPYVTRTDWEQLPKEIKDFEPKAALLGGEDGLALIAPVAQQAHYYLLADGWVALEVGAGQARQVMGLLGETQAYDHVDAVPDYQGIARVVRGRRRCAA